MKTYIILGYFENDGLDQDIAVIADVLLLREAENPDAAYQLAEEAEPECDDFYIFEVVDGTGVERTTLVTIRQIISQKNWHIIANQRIDCTPKDVVVLKNRERELVISQDEKVFVVYLDRIRQVTTAGIIMKPGGVATFGSLKEWADSQ